MRQRISTAVVLAVLLTVMAPIATVATHADEPLSQANATLRNASGVIVGTAAFTQTAVGVDIHVQVTDIDPGTHGIHIHTIGSCQPPDFTSAGGHFNPEGSQHGLENKQGPHAGDLPNLQVDADRSGELHYTNRFVTLGAGEHSLFDADRSALVIHAATDDQMTDPTGNSGARVACGEVQPGTGDSGNYCHTFDETGHTVCDAFLIFWERNGGLAVFGYPLTDAFMEANPDTGQEYLVQYFERQRFELHPENAGTVYEVLLGRLGAEILELQGRDWWTLPMGNPNDEHYFPETGHAIADVFWEYWSTHGLEYGDPGVSFRESLLLFGYPISEATQETNADGDTVLTQWFERARFEYHPENGTVNVILLGRLGAELLDFMEPEPEPEITVVATGLDNPRHLNSGPDGMLYVAEAGSGGDQCVTGEGPEGPGEFCYGPTGAITSITTDGDDMSEEVVSGFPSVAEPTGMFATGVHDVSRAADGTIYAILG
ncbi:MAG: ScyD/ScyE family protein, partial [Chloroflexota bacterium]|nr:ScyD/ScyE family protein [Chloroflexota bacterium]